MGSEKKPKNEKAKARKLKKWKGGPVEEDALLGARNEGGKEKKECKRAHETFAIGTHPD